MRRPLRSCHVIGAKERVIHSAIQPRPCLKIAGIPEGVVIELVGHDSKSMSAHYTHPGVEALKKAVAALPSERLLPIVRLIFYAAVSARAIELWKKCTGYPPLFMGCNTSSGISFTPKSGKTRRLTVCYWLQLLPPAGGLPEIFRSGCESPFRRGDADDTGLGSGVRRKSLTRCPTTAAVWSEALNKEVRYAELPGEALEEQLRQIFPAWLADAPR